MIYRTRNPLHGQRWTQHERITVLPLPCRARLAWWQAVSLYMHALIFFKCTHLIEFASLSQQRRLWICCRGHGRCEGRRGCRIPQWSDQGSRYGCCFWTTLSFKVQVNEGMKTSVCLWVGKYRVAMWCSFVLELPVLLYKWIHFIRDTTKVMSSLESDWHPIVFVYLVWINVVLACISSLPALL